MELVKIRGSDIIGISIENRCKMITIEQLKALNKPGNTAITEHARIRLYERNINIDDIVNGINTGEIIKQYSDDKPLPSCLILGFLLSHSIFI